MKEQLEDLFKSGQTELAVMTGLNIVSTDKLAEMWLNILSKTAVEKI